MQVYWTVDGAHRSELSTKKKCGLYSQFLDPRISYEETVKVAIGCNETVGHMHNETSKLSMCIRVGKWAAQGYTQPMMGVSRKPCETCDDTCNVQDMADGWGSLAFFSHLAQCYTQIRVDAVMAEMRKDFGRPRHEWRFYMDIILNQLFKNLPSQILQTECLLWMCKQAHLGTTKVVLNEYVMGVYNEAPTRVR